MYKHTLNGLKVTKSNGEEMYVKGHERHAHTLLRCNKSDQMWLMYYKSMYCDDETLHREEHHNNLYTHPFG